MIDFIAVFSQHNQKKLYAAGNDSNPLDSEYVQIEPLSIDVSYLLWK